MSKALRVAGLVLFGFVLLEGAYRLILTVHTKPDGVYELYAIGGSTTAGEPYEPALSFPSRVAARIAGPVALDNLARPGDSTYPQALALAARLRLRNRANPAAVLIYTGHNEHFTEPRTVPAAFRAYESVRDLLLYRSLLAGDVLCFVERRFNARGTRTLETYERHLRRALELSLDAGAVPVIATESSNLNGVEPSVECSRPECLAPLNEYRLAKRKEAAGDYAGALAGYWKALDLDPGNGFGRTNTKQNELVRRLAAEYKIPLVDSVALFSAASPHGIIGNTLMSDGHHPNLAGYELLARGFAAALHLPEAAPGRWVPSDPAVPLMYSGRWLITVSVGHPAPADRMALARKSYEDAARLAPEDFRPRLGLAIIAANGDFSFLNEPGASGIVALLGTKSPPDRAALFNAALALRDGGAPAPLVVDFLRTSAPAATPEEDVAVLRRALESNQGGLFRSLMSSHPEDKRLALAAARAFKAEGNRRAALEALIEAERREAAPARLREIAKLYAELGDRRHASGVLAAAAAREALAATRVPPVQPKQDAPSPRVETVKNAADWLIEAERAVKAGDRARALGAAASAERAGVPGSELRRLSGLYAELKEYAKAGEVLDRTASRDAGAKVDRARLYLATKQPAKALSALADASAQSPSDEERRRIALTLQDLGEAQRAVAVWKELTARRPNDAVAWHDRAVSEFSAGRADEALRDLKRSVTLAPDRLETYLTLGYVYSATGRLPEARAAYAAGLSRPTQNAALRELLTKAAGAAK